MIKKKDLDQDDSKVWEDYVKNPSEIYDKDKNLIGIAKMATPVRKTESDQYTFKLKLDI